MRYLMLVCEDVQDSATPPTQADRDGAPDVEAWWNAANASGNHVMGDRLRPPGEAMAVRVRGGETLVSQGPFAEGGELVLGFDVLECESAEEAVRIATGHPMAHNGVLELRALWPMGVG